MKKSIIFIVIIIVLLIGVGIYIFLQNVKSEEIEFEATIDVLDYKIKSYQKNDEYYIFVPKDIDISNLEISCNIDIRKTTSGEIIDEKRILCNNFKENPEVILTGKRAKQYKLKVMQSDIPSICINLDNISLEQLNKGSKDKKYAGNLQIIGANEEQYNITNKKIEFKGRGNSSWKYPKKPYQIKFEEAEDILRLNGKAKKWILLANFMDPTLVRNKLSFDIQQEIGLSDSVKATFVDLYINGEYIGNYTLCDKVEIGESRVNLKNEGGLIAEIDFRYGEMEEDKFTSEITETLFVIKDVVEDETEKACKEFEKKINEFEKVLYSPNSKWEEIEKLIDIESFAKYYFLIELEHDPDRFLSSTFLYKDGENDKIHIGPIWDSDFGYKDKMVNDDYHLNFIENHSEFYKKEDKVLKQDWYKQLYKYEEFVDYLNKVYAEQISPVYSNINKLVDRYVQSMSQSVNMNSIRWNNKKEEPENYQKKIQTLKEWIEKRVDYMNYRYK